MRIKSLHLQGFRCFKDAYFTFDSRLTILIGENGVGKSTIALALGRLIAGSPAGGDSPYNAPVPLSIKATFSLAVQDIERLLIDPLLPPLPPAEYITADDAQRRALMRSWLFEQGTDIELELMQSTRGIEQQVHWGQLYFRNNRIALNESGLLTSESGRGDWHQVLLELARNELDGTAPEYHCRFNTGFYPQIMALLEPRFKGIPEFRASSAAVSRSQAIEALSGAETASVLLNLRIHKDRLQRVRYERVRQTFTRLFPKYDEVEVVEESAGTGVPLVQFWETGQPNPLGLSQVSAGVQQGLTWLTNLIGREDLVVFVEHPEQHLHPHAMRFLQTVLREAAEKNQIILVTHDPHFVDRNFLPGLRRFWWVKGEGTKIFGLDQGIGGLDERDAEILTHQLKAVFRQVGNREMLFARAVVLVEDESQQEFLIPVAATLGHDIDAHSVSIISVGGDKNYGQFEAVLSALAIPYVGLKDKPWGDDKKYSPNRFFSLGMELEAYLNHHGLKETRDAAVSQYGDNKPRIARIVGEQLTREQIPSIFDALLQNAIALATGKPALGT